MSVSPPLPPPPSKAPPHTLIYSWVFFRAFLRLLILKVTRRPVLSPPIPEREIDPATLADLTPSPSTSTSSLPPKYSPTDSPPPHFKNNKQHNTFPPTASSGPNPLLAAASLHKPQQPQAFGAAAATSSPIEDYLLPKALSTLDVKPPLTLVRPLNTFRDWVSEIIYLLRPLVYGESSSTSHDEGRC